MKSEIAVTRRTTYRAEEAVTKLEKDKKDQDKLIDHMNEQIKKLNEQKALYTAQLTAQQEETLAAQQTLKEAAIEMDKIQASKKTLLEDWQKALQGMQRRDKALQAISDAIKAQEDVDWQLKSEMTGLKKEINQEAEISEKASFNLNKYKADNDSTEKKISDCELLMDKLSKQLGMLNDSVNSTNEEIKKLGIEKDTIHHQLLIVDKSIMRLHSETKKRMEDILNNISDQTTIEKSTANMQKKIEKTSS